MAQFAIICGTSHGFTRATFHLLVDAEKLVRSFSAQDEQAAVLSFAKASVPGDTIKVGTSHVVHLCESHHLK